MAAVKRLIIIVQIIYFLALRGYWAHSAHEHSQLNRVCCFCFFGVFLVSRGSSFNTYFIFTAAGVVPCGGRETSPRTSS